MVHMKKNKLEIQKKLSSPFYMLFQMYALEIDGSKKKEYRQLIIYAKWEGDETVDTRSFISYTLAQKHYQVRHHPINSKLTYSDNKN